MHKRLVCTHHIFQQCSKNTTRGNAKKRRKAKYTGALALTRVVNRWEPRDAIKRLSRNEGGSIMHYKRYKYKGNH